MKYKTSENSLLPLPLPLPLLLLSLLPWFSWYQSNKTSIFRTCNVLSSKLEIQLIEIINKSEAIQRLRFQASGVSFQFSSIRSRKPVIWSPYSIFSFLRSLYFIHLWSFFFIIWIWFSWLLLLPFLHPLLFLLFLISNIGSMISVKLENHNSLLWKSQFLHALRANHVDGFVDGTFWSISTWISVRFRWKRHKRDKSRLSCFDPARLECLMLDQCHSL